MVRLNVPEVKEAYNCKCVDIQYSLTKLGFRRDRSLPLPVIPSVSLVCKDDISSAGVRGNESEVICIDDSSEDEVSGNESKKITVTGENHKFDVSLKGSGNKAEASVTTLLRDKKETYALSGEQKNTAHPSHGGTIGKVRSEEDRESSTSLAMTSLGCDSSGGASLSGRDSVDKALDDSDDEYAESSDAESSDAESMSF